MLLRLAPALLAVWLVAPLMAAETKSPVTPKPKLGSHVVAWDTLQPRSTAKGERRDVANSATPTLEIFECHITTLDPGRESHPPHRHPQEELIIVKEGSLEVHINGATRRVGAGSVLFFASNDSHALKNVGETRATYWVVNLTTSATLAPAKHHPSPALRSAVFDWEKLKADTTKTGARRAILKASTATMQELSVHATTVNAREAAHGPHRHADDEIVLVKEGTLELNINGRTHHAPSGSVVFFASNDLHGMRNAGDTRATYYVIRMITAETPKPATK